MAKPPTNELTLDQAYQAAFLWFDHKGGRDGITDLATMDEDITEHEHDDETEVVTGEGE